MLKITFPLREGYEGPQVGNLQAALQLFLEHAFLLAGDEDSRVNLMSSLREEQTGPVYKDATRKLVSLFQDERRLEVQEYGNVDQTTANAMNALLRELGILEEDGWNQVVAALQEQGLTLHAIHRGTDRLAAIDEKIGSLGRMPTLSLNMQGEAVKQLHAQLGSLGLDLPKPEIGEGIFGVGTRDVLMQLQAKHELVQSGAFDDATRNALAIDAGIAIRPSRVEGRVVLDNGLPAANLKLRIVNKGFGDSADVLGETETDERGYYALPYEAGGGAVHLEVRTFDEHDNELRLSNPKLNADRGEVLHLVAPASVKAQLNEFALLANDLSRVVGGDINKLAQAQESAGRQDVALLHQTTGWDARLIAIAATAVNVNERTGIQPDALYGAFRAGLPHDPDHLALVSPQAFAAALNAAKSAGIIALDDAQLNAAQNSFGVFALETQRRMIAPGTLSSIGEMLDKARIEPTSRKTFERLLFTPDADERTIWEEAKAQGIPQEQLASLQLQGKLAYLTLNNAPLTEALFDEILGQDNLARLVDQDLYRKEVWVSRLLGMATEGGTLNADKLAKLIPTAYTHPELRDRLDAYARDLAGKVRQSFPSKVVNRMLETDVLTLGSQHAELKAPVQALLGNSIGKGFQLGRTPVGSFLKQHGETLCEGIPDSGKAQAAEGIKLLARAYQMTPNDETMAALLELGFTSARQVTVIPRSEFVERYWKRFGSRETTMVIWDKSSQINSVTFNVYTLAKKVGSTPPLLAVSGTAERHDAAKAELKSLLKEYPAMESLFDSLDFCECEHCRSVLSPAAYLVDLLRFVDPPESDWTHTLNDWKLKHEGNPYTGPEFQYLKPYDALIQRRPDLPHLSLTCENTNTAMPYIDLVNEILEYYVAHDHLDEHAVRDTGDAISSELLAEPLHLIPEAYEVLKSACYPLTLPFDLGLETVRRFCDYHDLPLWRLLDTFRASDALFGQESDSEASYDRARIFAEYLGLTPVEYALYTKTIPQSWTRLYGYDKPGDTEIAVRGKLSSASQLARRLGVSYKELVELVQTRFVNPQLQGLEVLRKLGVEPGDVFRYKKQAGYAPFPSEEEAEFEQRLQRLTKPFAPHFDAKQWLDESWANGTFKNMIVLRDLDAGGGFEQTVLTYADGTELDGWIFEKLNVFVRLRKRLGWTVEETDLALQLFMPKNEEMTSATLGKAMKTALIYLAHLAELSGLLQMGKNNRQSLLTLWGDMPSRGKNALYAQLFLTRDILQDAPGLDDPLGNYLSDPELKINDHLTAIQAALGLTPDEMALILQDGNTGDESHLGQAKLSMGNLSLLYRYGVFAKALKLPVADLITLKALSGLDPFHPLIKEELTVIEEDHPLRHTLAFVRCVEQAKAGSLTVSELDYLFRHRLDPLGVQQENTGADLAWLRALAEELREIAGRYALPEASDDLTDDTLRQTLSLAFAPDVAEMLLDRATYRAVRTPVLPDDQLDPAVLGSAEGVSVSYDETRQEQQVTVIGAMNAAAIAALLSQLPQPAPDDPAARETRELLTALLGDIESQSMVQLQAFYLKYFDDGLLKFEEFFGADVTMTRAERRLNLMRKVVPYLRAKLMRQAVTQAMVAQLGGEPALLESLLTNGGLLTLPDMGNEPLLARFEGLGQPGLSAVITPSEPNSAIIQRKVEHVEVMASDQIDHAHWRGYIEVPRNGAYRFYAHLGKKDAAFELRLDQDATPVASGKAGKDADEISAAVELKAGVLYALALDATHLQNGTFELLVKGEITPKTRLNEVLTAIPWEEADGAIQACTLLAKALRLADDLGLSDREIRHVLTHPSDFGGANWRLLPTRANGESNAANAVTLFGGWLTLRRYAALKKQMAGGGEDLIGVFERARMSTPESVEQLGRRIAEITRRQPEQVQAVAAELRLVLPDQWAGVVQVERLWQAMQVAEKFGVTMPSLKKWLTPQPNAAIAREVRHAVKSRLEPDVWQRVAKAVFDPLRQRQRDALVARIMHMREDLDSMEKLFEFFLIDPGNEPVVETSRLRLAISSMQTFIQRCFLNLEKQVHPSVLNAQHWSWMKRYRVWEANRRIFLYPENWLEPEWRDDKTHLYQELESSLLQGDVTNQLAEDALYVYLQKLNQLARLEMVSLYAEEKPSGPPVMHVLGRTASQPRQYFYRRYVYRMWTPWEPVNAEIDGEHIAAVMWHERLHVFWLTFMEKVEESSGGQQTTETGAMGALPLNKLVASAAQASRGGSNRMLDMQLNWSECHEGTWTARQSSGFGHVIALSEPFDARKVFVTVSQETGTETGAVLIHLNGLSPRMSFRAVSKNSPPQFKTASGTADTDTPYSHQQKRYNRYEGSSVLSVTFVPQTITTDGVEKAAAPASQTLLGKAGSYSILPTGNRMSLPNEEYGSLVSPVFYADDMYTFFVEPSLAETTIDQWQGYTITRPSQREKWDYYVKELPRVSPVIPPKFRQEAFNPPPKWTQPGVFDPTALYAVQPQADAIIQPGIAVQFGDSLIGNAGVIGETSRLNQVITSVGGLIQRL